MKLKITTFSLLFVILSSFYAKAQFNSGNGSKVVATNYDVSDNLDLQAVASIFGDSDNLEDFEQRLNSPDAQISNLDLNNDGYVDYLRVIETADNDIRVIVLQSVLGQDTFQDVATIELEKQRTRNRRSSVVNVQIVGNPFLYGANYIYEPNYWRTPIFFDYLWMPNYSLYHSPWYWGYYPTYYSYWRPMPIFRYRRHITPMINTRNRYAYSNTRRITRARNIYSRVSRNSYERNNPDRSFIRRNRDVRNRRDLINGRSNNTIRRGQNSRNGRDDVRNGRGQNNGIRNNTIRRGRSQDSRIKRSGTRFGRGNVRTSDSRKSGNLNTRKRIERNEKYNKPIRSRSSNRNKSITRRSNASRSPQKSSNIRRSRSANRSSSSRGISSNRGRR